MSTSSGILNPRISFTRRINQNSNSSAGIQLTLFGEIIFIQSGCFDGRCLVGISLPFSFKLILSYRNIDARRELTGPVHINNIFCSMTTTSHAWEFAQNHDGGDPKSKIRQWSSFIGIVTAIVGNILISFALNLQRYAHIRLDREQGNNGQDHRWESSRARGYAREVSEIADRRAELNLRAPFHDELPSEYERHRDKADASNGHDDTLGARQVSPPSRKNSESTIQPPKDEKETGGNSKSYLRSPYWWAGMLLMMVGESGNFLAYGFAPASIVSPLGVVALISNCIIAPCLLKERFRQRDFWGVVIAIAGACTVVLSAQNSTADLGPKDLWSAITRWEFELYLGITAVLMAALMWMSSKYGERLIVIDLGLVGLFGKDTFMMI